MSAVIDALYKGDTVTYCTDAGERQAQVVSVGTRLNVWKSHTVSVRRVIEGIGMLCLPIDSHQIVQVERDGMIVWPPEVEQMSFW